MFTIRFSFRSLSSLDPPLRLRAPPFSPLALSKLPARFRKCVFVHSLCPPPLPPEAAPYKVWRQARFRARKCGTSLPGCPRRAGRGVAGVSRDSLAFCGPACRPVAGVASCHSCCCLRWAMVKQTTASPKWAVGPVGDASRPGLRPGLRRPGNGYAMAAAAPGTRVPGSLCSTGVRRPRHRP